MHGLRHSIATHLLHQGMETHRYSQVLGHATLESTQIYTHIEADTNKDNNSKQDKKMRKPKYTFSAEIHQELSKLENHLQEKKYNVHTIRQYKNCTGIYLQWLNETKQEPAKSPIKQ
ncbi:MAG: tyrosine-type recombinase/integrase [Saprospiraceae bacterium]|nr:tyrosine-type recombinase/integrase [Saprospiraceae bacterium]